MITIDFETRSALDLVKCGPWKYAEHHTTDILCLAIKVDDSDTLVWLPRNIRRLMSDNSTYLSDDDLSSVLSQTQTVEAHNVEFEVAVWHHIMHKRYGYPDLSNFRLSCTAVRAAVQALPRKLADVCQVLNVPVQKDTAGHRLMLKMCKPRKPRKQEREADPDWPDKLYWHETEADMLGLIDYCVQDVEAEYALSRVLNDLTQYEYANWCHDQLINRRGVHIDIPSVGSIIDCTTRHEQILLRRVADLTGGAVSSTRQVKATISWLAGQGVHAENLQKQTVSDLLADDALPPVVREMLTIRRTLAKSSVSKYQAMVKRAQGDSRARSTAMHHGASTGRATGKALQPLNMPRDTYDPDVNLDNVLALFRARNLAMIGMTLGDPFTAASRCLRGCICAAPGNTLYCADWSSIEGIGVAWLAMDTYKLGLFRRQNDGTGAKIYNITAGEIFNKEPNRIIKGSAEYQVGKVVELSMGYAGGIGAFAAMAANYGIDLEMLPDLVLSVADPDDIRGKYGAESLATTYLAHNPDAMSLDAAISCDVLKRKWRRNNARIQSLWHRLNSAAVNAVANPGEVFSCGYIQYATWADPANNVFLLCRLPSGRLLYYCDPRVQATQTDWGKTESLTYMTVDSVTRQWVRRHAYGGLLAENVTQAMCRDILTEAMHRVEAAGYPVVMHVYDEIVAETPDSFGDLGEFTDMMEACPTWAPDIPLKAEGWTGTRYRK